MNKLSFSGNVAVMFGKGVVMLRTVVIVGLRVADAAHYVMSMKLKTSELIPQRRSNHLTGAG